MSEELAKGLGLAVREARTKLGMSQETLSAAAGLDRAYVSGLERGTRNPTLETLQRLAESLRIPLHVLMQRAEELA
ncbi:helix-turn-helix domain-containing protein [Nocardioides sp. SYSU DS0651]|uniref:helix-turn-helix domain-containing protein n=1 Tax=Nocardioides sp. SYSU DS0651 TaxID=3415955 RepID=UPI003F4BFEFB